MVEAVRAAIDVQNELAGLNAERHGEARMDYRIGLNLGDVIADGDDLYGDGSISRPACKPRHRPVVS